MTAAEIPRERHRLLLVVCLLAVAYLATRFALMWRFPWFVDETTFAGYARDVHGNISQLFIAEQDKKGLLPSWLGATLISTGVAPVTAMRLLAAAGAGLAAVCGGLLMRRLYGLREGLVTAGLVALGPYFLVTASVGIYDAMVAGLVAAAVLIAVRMARRPRLASALLLGVVLGAGGLTKPTSWVAVIVLPFTLLLFDYTTPRLRRRLLIWLALAFVAVALGYAITSIARVTPYYDQKIATANQRSLGEALEHLGPTLRANWHPLWAGLHGYLTLPGLVLVALGVVFGARRHQAGAAILAVWTLAVLISTLLLPLTEYPRYVAAAIVPLSGFAALGAFGVWDALAGRWPRRRNERIALAAALAVLALLPATLFDARVLADPVHARYPGLDEQQYVLLTSAQTQLAAVADAIKQRGGPYPVGIDVGIGYPWGLDLRLNGTRYGDARRFRVFSFGTAAQKTAARYVVTDGETSDSSPEPGFRLILRRARPRGGAVVRLYERV